MTAARFKAVEQVREAMPHYLVGSWSWVEDPTMHSHDCPGCAIAPALALLERLAEAAEPLTNFDFAATQWIDGLTHDGHELRAIHAKDVEELKRLIPALVSALAAVRAGSASLTDGQEGA